MRLAKILLILLAISGCTAASGDKSLSGFPLWSGTGVLQIDHQEMYLDLAEKLSSAPGSCITLAARDTHSAHYFRRFGKQIVTVEGRAVPWAGGDTVWMKVGRNKIRNACGSSFVLLVDKVVR